MISSREPKIIYEDSKILVCEKPAGLATQTSRVGQKDLVSMMMNHVSDGLVCYFMCVFYCVDLGV